MRCCVQPWHVGRNIHEASSIQKHHQRVKSRMMYTKARKTVARPDAVVVWVLVGVADVVPATKEGALQCAECFMNMFGVFVV